MPHSFRIAYFTHSIRSDWNNGNAHFLRGLLRELGRLRNQVEIFEPRQGWSLSNLEQEESASRALSRFTAAYPELQVHTYDAGPDLPAPDGQMGEASAECLAHLLGDALKGTDIVLMHEWNKPALAQCLLSLRPKLGFRLLFHDTHHRSLSAPGQIRRFSVHRFDGVLAFGETLRRVYQHAFHCRHVWSLHEAADPEVFYPRPSAQKLADVVWIGNWGDGDRPAEIEEFLLKPARNLEQFHFKVYGVRYPEPGLEALRRAHVDYGGYLPNLEAPEAYSAARLTVHIPRRQYSTVAAGIPTIRVFEALACGVPLISAPWLDSEHLFRKPDFRFVHSTAQMREAMRDLLDHPEKAEDQAAHGLETILARHTCAHRARELMSIFQELTA